jgi:hypothetical protein
MSQESSAAWALLERQVGAEQTADSSQILLVNTLRPGLLLLRMYFRAEKFNLVCLSYAIVMIRLN